MVMVLTACPAGLRGDLSRWLEEVAPGVFVGHLSKRVRERVWSRVGQGAGGGKALMVYSAKGVQRLRYEAHGHDWHPTDFEGLVVMMRPSGRTPARLDSRPKGKEQGWSTATRLRRFGREIEQRHRQDGQS